MLLSCLQAYTDAANRGNGRVTAEEEIWGLEEAYFSNLYNADYVGVLAHVHNKFLGWPGNLPQPIDREGSDRFMRQLVPKPAPCTFKIERAGIRLMGEVALTQYIIHVNCSDAAGVAKSNNHRG